MPATVTANMMTVVHQASNGISQAFPDVCLTPAAPSPIPIPYPNIAMSSTAADTATTVKADGNPIMVKDSKYATSMGDEAGANLGVVSGKIKGSANPAMFSMDVKAEGKNVFRQLDIMLHNGNSKPINTPPGPNNQPPKPGMGKQQKPDKYKVKDVKWAKTKCKCGDPVKINSTTENFKDGMILVHRITRTDDNLIIGSKRGKIKGDAAEIEWISQYGPWRIGPSKYKVKAVGRGGPKDSSNELEIEIPPDKALAKVGYAMTGHSQNPVRTKVGKKTITSYVQGPQAFGWDYGYDIGVVNGVYQILCKIQLNPVAPIAPYTALTAKRLKKLKKAAQSQILTYWDRKWKLHRIDCKRGKKCHCRGGCCLFPIRVKVQFVAAGAHHAVDLHPGMYIKGGTWWDSGNWWEKDEGHNDPPSYAHEFGHLIGMFDEYPAGAAVSKYAKVKGSIMNQGTGVLKHHIKEYPAAGDSLHGWFEKHSGDKYEAFKT